jgi:hypothetical protein
LRFALFHLVSKRPQRSLEHQKVPTITDQIGAGDNSHFRSCDTTCHNPRHRS